MPALDWRKSSSVQLRHSLEEESRHTPTFELLLQILELKLCHLLSWYFAFAKLLYQFHSLPMDTVSVFVARKNYLPSTLPLLVLYHLYLGYASSL
ncbi:hypothetical protein AVEN_154784-1 [Araneus ventricosus]|uniref:Uncharacterized protein n=1 Tax=Araneus ventricosus TaxID=182803 RepID=A0A4Y2BW90_ARAVE|nr:hypothetical protein AVEN_154784-1 [Araneus ventricosus]